MRRTAVIQAHLTCEGDRRYLYVFLREATLAQRSGDGPEQISGVVFY